MALRHGFVQGRPEFLGLPVVHIRAEGQKDAHQVRIPCHCSLASRIRCAGEGKRDKAQNQTTLSQGKEERASTPFSV